VGHHLTTELIEFNDLSELSAAVARDVAEFVNNVVASKGVFYLALSGGNTPRPLYHILGTTYRESIPWKSVHIFFCDERFVPHESPMSNFQMVRETLLDLISIPKGNVHPFPTTGLKMEDAAREYETQLRRFFTDGADTFDLIVLGVGKDGHTASLFPGSPVLDEKEKWVAGVEVDGVPPRRITLTYPILNHAARVYFLVSGSEKSDATKTLLQSTVDYHSCPSAGVHPEAGRLIWWVDRAALRA